MGMDYITTISSALVINAMIAFSRVGTAIILVPGLGDARIPARIRIASAVILTLALLPALPFTGVEVDKASVLVGLIAFEATVGVFIAISVRLFLTSVHILGAKIGYTAGLANALSPNDGNFESASSLSSLMYMGAIVFVFATNTHHLILSGLMRSYEAIPVGTLPAMDLAQQIARIGGDAFYIALYVGAPFLVFSILFNAALGLANRVMPSMQVFFVASPAMIVLGLLLLSMMIPTIIVVLNNELSNWLQDLVR